MKYSLSTSLLILSVSASTIPFSSLGNKFDYYAPTSELVLNNADFLNSFTPKSTSEKNFIAKSHIAHFLGVKKDEIVVTDVVSTSTGIKNYFFAPTIDGIQVVNAQANTHVDEFGNVLATSASWIKGSGNVNRQSVFCTPIQALKNFASLLDIPYENSEMVETENEEEITISGFSKFGDVTIKTRYYQTEYSLEKVYDLEVPFGIDYWNVFVSLVSGKVVGLNNWSFKEEWEEDTHVKSETRLTKRRDYVYTVVALPRESIAEDRKYVINPADKIASPLGWHNSGSGDLAMTIGNNVISQDDNLQALRTPHKPDYKFNYPVDLTQDATTYWEAGATNTFYITNILHDITYHYGFDEASGNFQYNNFDKGGKGNDRILAKTQSGKYFDNAYFVTPPDGKSGEMGMFLFKTTPTRDGDMDNTVVLHELMHGINTRLTGGKSNSNCLSNDVGKGFNEGMADVNAFVLTTKASDNRNTDKSAGRYVTNSPNGVRGLAYSTDMVRNPSTYKDFSTTTGHGAGAVFASMMFEVFWNIVDKSGYTSEILKDVKSGKGNSDFYQIIFDGLKLQPCNPSYKAIRDSLLLADKNKGSKYFCEIWRGFAKRGMGLNADSSYVNNFELPQGC